MPRSKHRSRATTWLMVNGGVSAIALAVTFVERAILSGTQSEVLAAATATAVLYISVFSACALNLRGRRRTMADESSMRPIALSSCYAHPVGSACERFIHANTRLAAGQTLGQSSTWLATLLPTCACTGCILVANLGAADPRGVASGLQRLPK